VVAGYTGIYPRTEIALARYNRAGSLDTSFGVGGKVTTAIGSSSHASGVAVQADGKIVAAGGATGASTGSAFAVTRYNADGSPDTSFGGDGQVTTTIGSSAGASDLVLQPDGKIVLAGSAQEGFALARYNPDGSLDPSFGGDGTVTTPIGAATSLALQPDGKLVAAGVSGSGTGSNRDFALARYNTDGSLDTSFDGDGTVTTAIGSGEDHASALALQPDGKIVAAGWTDNGNYDFALVRYNPNGSLDPSFGAGGKVTTALGPNHDLIDALVRQPDGTLVAGGLSESLSTNDTFTVARYQADGSLDSGFGAGGSLRTRGGSPTALAVQPDGKLVAAGWVIGSSDGSNDYLDFALVRYLSGNERCLVPNVKRRTVPAAKRLLHRAYCSAGRLTRAFSSSVKRGRVISQTPKAGTRKAIWARVTLKISKGKRKQR
jgi:uncharacterized delta-60 repeat protein